MTQLSNQFMIQKVQRATRTALFSGIATVNTDDTVYYEMTFESDETQIFVAKNCLVLHLANVMDVELNFLNVDNTVASTIRRDVGGFIFLPFKVSATVRNPTRLGYTIGVPVQAVTG